MAKKAEPPAPARSGREPGAPPKAAQGELTTSTFSQSSRDMHVVVEKPQDGFMCTLSMVARVPLPPEQLYELLVDPVACRRIFTSLKRVRNRRVLADDGAGSRTVEVEQTGAWRFLCFRGSFTVRMIVEQRAADRTITFRLAKSGFMRQFTGTWSIRPYDNASLDQLVNKHRPSALHRLQAGLRAVEQGLGLVGGEGESLVQLQQSIAPAFKPPAAVARVMQRIAAKQISQIMGDLQQEVRRINAADARGDSGGGGGAAAAGEQQEDAEGDADAGRQRQRRHKRQLAAHIGPLK